MNFSYSLDQDCGLRSASSDTLGLLKTFTGPNSLSSIEASLGLSEILRNRIFEAVILIVGGGMNDSFEGMSRPSQSRADFALEIYPDKTKILFIPMARYTYRSIQDNPPSTDARNIGKHLVRNGVSPTNIVLEEWSMCTFGNAVITELLLRSASIRDIPIYIITSEWTRERSEIVFPLFMENRDTRILTVQGDLDTEDEKKRKLQDHIVNEQLYRQIIPAYGIDKDNRLARGLKYLKYDSSSTGNIPDLFSWATTRAVKDSGIDTRGSYGLKKPS